MTRRRDFRAPRPYSRPLHLPPADAVARVALAAWVLNAACGEPTVADANLAQAEAKAQPACAAVPAQMDGCQIADSVNARLGMATDSGPDDDYWMDKETYVLSYNPDKFVANWVSWRLRSEDMGTVGRSGRFRTDTTLPPQFFRVTRTDYSGTGFDRGHLCPSKERTRTQQDNVSTFLMTNIHPQVPELNMGPWSQLEEYEQERAERANAELHIIAGPIFDSTYGTIGRGIAIPRASFRIVVELEEGQTLEDIDETTEIIAVIMPNDPAVEDHDWREYVVPVDQIEAQTGYDFLAALPAELEDVIEAR